MAEQSGTTRPALQAVRQALIRGTFLILLSAFGTVVAEEPAFAPEPTSTVIAEAAHADTAAFLDALQPGRTEPATTAPDISDYRPVPEHGIEPRVWIAVSEPGRLELRSSRMRLLASERSEYPLLGHVLTPEEDHFEQVFFLRFEPANGRNGTQRLLRARPDQDLYLILGRSTDASGVWHLRRVESDGFDQARQTLVAALPPVHWAQPEDLERELEALLESDSAAPAEEPAASPDEDLATRLRDEGIRRLAAGDYVGALEHFEASLELTPDAQLADRAARLRVFLRLRAE